MLYPMPKDALSSHLNGPVSKNLNLNLNSRQTSNFPPKFLFSQKTTDAYFVLLNILSTFLLHEQVPKLPISFAGIT